LFKETDEEVLQRKENCSSKRILNLRHLSFLGLKKKRRKGYEPLGRNCRRTLLTQLTDRFFG
jgi:hypothetical protein